MSPRLVSLAVASVREEGSVSLGEREDCSISPLPPMVVQLSSVGVRSNAALTVEVETKQITSDEALAIVGRTIPTARATHLTATGQWSWEQMRDYVVGQVEQRWGPRPRNPLKESGIFKGFISRWGDKSEPIARAAFEVYRGTWNGAPISIERFSKGSDPYFAEAIAKNI